MDHRPDNPENRESFVVLRLWVDPQIPGLREIYREHVSQHNHHIQTAKFPNSGFDLFAPYELNVQGGFTGSNLLKLGVRCEMVPSTGYFLMPRSSLSKTPLMQSNHIGLIDAGYRGEIMAPIRNLSSERYQIEKHARLFQLCHPSTKPIWVKMVEDVSELSSTERGEGGFGSTGAGGTIHPNN